MRDEKVDAIRGHRAADGVQILRLEELSFQEPWNERVLIHHAVVSHEQFLFLFLGCLDLQ